VSALVGDQPGSWPVLGSEEVFGNDYLRVTVDTIVDPSGAEHARTVVRSRDAVGILALDDDDRVLFVQQYRHPAQARLVELPAGMLDIEGEDPADAARRELAEEADMQAANLEPLLSLASTPGYSTERWQVFLATGLSSITTDFVREAEEADMDVWWLPFEDALEAVREGRICDTMTVVSLLALADRRQRA
jgi:8-oxo-dGTP pyrophosphatase MutT (NUDIX family)